MKVLAQVVMETNNQKNGEGTRRQIPNASWKEE